MSKAAVIDWSQSGNTEAMAEAVADGARKAGADTVCVRVDSADASTVSDADGVALGCPAMGSEELEEGEILSVKMNDGEPVQNVPRSIKEEGHQILKLIDNEDGTYNLIVKKVGD